MIPYIVTLGVISLIMVGLGWLAWRHRSKDGKALAVLLWVVALLVLVMSPSEYRDRQAAMAAFEHMSPEQHLAAARNIWIGLLSQDRASIDAGREEITRHLSRVPASAEKQAVIEMIHADIVKYNEAYERAKARKQTLELVRKAVDDAADRCPKFLDAPIGNKKCPQLDDAKAELEALEKDTSAVTATAPLPIEPLLLHGVDNKTGCRVKAELDENGNPKEWMWDGPCPQADVGAKP